MPRSWAELLGLIAALLGGGQEADAAALEWIRQAVEALWGKGSLHDLDRQARAVAFQKACGVWIGLWEVREGDLAFYPDQRDVVRRIVARYWGGIIVDGPPWRLGPWEERPTYAEWAARADFGLDAAASEEQDGDGPRARRPVVSHLR